MRNIFFILFALIPCTIFSQFVIDNDIPFTVGGKQLLNPSTGGLNAPQFSGFDINFDGKQDLFVFDRTAYKILVFINESTDSEIAFRYHPEYEKIFPHLEDWAILRDYNCDGLPDIFTYYSGSTSVYKAINTTGVMSYDLVEDKISYVDDIHIPIYTSRSDLPEFTDVNGDGDIDVLTFSVTGTTIRYFENTSQESFWGCDSLQYDLMEYCWGSINEGFTCGGADLGIVCKGAVNEEAENARMHVGSTVLALDKDGDGDKDIILGDVSCSNLVYYLNGGDADYAEIVSKDTLFPSNTMPAKFREYLASFLTEIDPDDNRDLIVSTNDNNFGLNKDNIWYYKNLNTNDTFDFEYVQSDFLLDQTIDIGANAKPVFCDYNADGLKDIVIGVGNTYDASGVKKYGLWLYENTGTATAPAYTFVTDDYADMAYLLIPEMFPAFTDIDNDGDEDMFIGINDGSVIFRENIAGAGATAVYAVLPEFNYDSVDPGINAAPFFYDISGDGLTDLIVGEQNGNLNYYENTGSAADAEFTLQNDNLGGVDVRKPGYLTGNATPFFYRNENDSLILLVGSESGAIHKYDEIESSLSGEFHERDTMFLKTTPGYFSTIQAADMNNDGQYEYLTGNNRGGIQFFKPDPDLESQYPHTASTFSVYPNPSKNLITITATGLTAPAVYRITDLLGGEVMQVSTPETHFSLNISGLSAGIYFITVHSDQAAISVVKFIKS